MSANIDTSIAYVGSIVPPFTGYWSVAIGTTYERSFDTFDEAQDYQDALIVELGQ